MHAQLIREKQTLKNKMLEMSRQAARETQVKVDASLKNQEIIDVSVSYDASDTILERCVAGKTQNSNESLHSCIWRKCPKEVFVSKRRLEIAVTEAIENHNLGYVKSLEAKEVSCLNDSFSLTIAERQDKRRISQNVSMKQKKRKRNATNTNAAYSAASGLSRQLSSATGTTVSRQTEHRYLGHIGLYAGRPVRCVPLTATHCRLRLTWSREHALGTPQQWSRVMFSNESRFRLGSDSRRKLIRGAPGTRYHQENTIERHRYGGAGWLVWGGIILGSRTDLHV
ncbi:HTH_Tnp_Tc3_2 domain-containing protein [Trichonephila clavipes]|nr:HTH_Tnp_Tc3_2 domain-containing protein [Trichonephila clavipes]